MEENGHLDILCNNAGIGSTDDVLKLMSINLVSVYFIRSISQYLESTIIKFLANCSVNRMQKTTVDTL